MPYVNVKITREGATPDQKRQIIAGVTDLLVDVLRQSVNFFLVLGRIGPQLDLCQRLVGERRRHHKARMSHGVTEIHQTPLGQQDDAFAVGPDHVRLHRCQCAVQVPCVEGGVSAL